MVGTHNTSVLYIYIKSLVYQSRLGMPVKSSPQQASSKSKIALKPFAVLYKSRRECTTLTTFLVNI